MIITKTLKRLLILIPIFSVITLSAQDNLNNNSEVQKQYSCGKAVIQYLYKNYFDSTDLIIDQIKDGDYLLDELLSECKNFNADANSVLVPIKDIKLLPIPSILHLNTGHYLIYNGIDENNLFKIYDPAASHIKSVSFAYFQRYFSGYSIIFSNKTYFQHIQLSDISRISGNYMHEYPPPNQNPGNDNGLEGIIPVAECRNNRQGSPLLSINPLSLNVVAEDVPLWYNAGIGPNIELQLVYNSNDQQELNGGLAMPTQYFPLGKRWNFSYASFYSLLSANEIILIMPDGRRQKFTYSNGQMVPEKSNFYHKLERYAVTGGYGYTLTFKGSKLKYKYDNPLHKKLTAIQDRNGNIVSLQYNIDNNLTQITDANGRSVHFILNENGYITQATDPVGRTALFSYGYTGNSYLIGITDMGGYSSNLSYNQVEILQQAQPGYHLEDQIVSITTPIGTSTISYDATGNIYPGSVAYVLTFTNPNSISAQVSFEYVTANIGLTNVYDNNGNAFGYQLDLVNKRVSNVTYPDPTASVFYGYDSCGNKNSITVGTFETLYNYDLRGNIIQITDPRNKITSLTYFSNDNLETITDPMDRVITFDYDGNSNILSIETPVNIQFFSYFLNGNLQSSTDPNNNITTYGYDNLGYLTSINYPSGNPALFVNDLIGRPTSITLNGIIANVGYNSLDQILNIAYPANGSQVNFTYSFTNLTQITDQGGRKTYYTYDGMSQIIKSQSPQGTISLSRDANGNILNLYINGQITNYEYDKLGRVLRITNPDGTTKQYSYDELGNLLTRIDEEGVMTTYLYDYKFLINKDYSDNTADITLSYNDNGELIEIIDGNGTTSFGYDDGGRLISLNGPGSGDDLSYTYDSTGNRKTMTMEGLNLNYSYDALSRLTNVVSNYASAEYSYDNNNNLLKMIYGNGSFTDYTYDNLNRLTTLNNKKSTNEIISGFAYTYDNASMISKIIDNEGNISNYNYDYAYQLINENVVNPAGKTLWHNQFTYDNMGNRLTLDKNGILDNYTYNINNQLTTMTTTSINVSGIVEADSTTVVYVENIKAKTTWLGNNLISFTVSDIPLDQSKDTLQLYAKVNEMLATVDDSAKFICSAKTMPDGTVNMYLFTDIENVNPENINTIYIKKNLINYYYDANGNLTQRISPFDTTIYSYDAENRLIKVLLPDGYSEEYIYDGFGQRVKVLINGTLDKSYIYDYPFEAVTITESANTQYLTRGLNLGGGIGGLIGVKDNLFGSTYNQFNHRGDVINIINSNESLLSQFEYEAFGELKDQNGSNIHDFKFSTKELNELTGLSYFGYRDYFKEMGKWITIDPIGLYGGDNLYEFINNNPMNQVDYYGLNSSDCSFYSNDEIEELKNEMDQLIEEEKKQLWREFNTLWPVFIPGGPSIKPFIDVKRMLTFTLYITKNQNNIWMLLEYPLHVFPFNFIMEHSGANDLYREFENIK